MVEFKKKLLDLGSGLFLSSSAYVDSITTFKCSFNKDNYEYTINIYNDE